MSHRLVDLSMPIVTDHFRWPAAREVSGDWSDASPFRVTRVSLSCHSFTHVDARRHMLADGEPIEATPLDAVAGPCFVADLSDVSPNEAIGAARLERALEDRADERIVLLASGWDRQRDWREASYWREAPWIERDAAEHLASLDLTAVAFDFPQDRTIRLSLDGVVPPIAEHITHDVLLRRGVTLIEYLVNTRALEHSRVFLCALPLKIEGADGAPSRVVAIESF